MRQTLLRVASLLPLLLPGSIGNAEAQPRFPDPGYYLFPVREVAGYFSANFGEMRPDHFHSGVDVKTDGTVGKPVVAAAEGYVSRIFCSPSGYGRALYVVHPNGTTSVYGHLQSFAPDIEAFFQAERYRLHRNRIDISCDSTQFPVQRGQEIGRSGNTGNSFGPHLHYEIRDNRTGQTLNTIAARILRPKDRIPPLIQRLHYVEIDTVAGVPVHAPLQSYDLERTPAGEYRLKGVPAVDAGTKGYFIVEASDRKEDVSNTFGIYRLQAAVDGEPWFEYRMDGFSFDHSRYCNAASYYPMQAASRNEVIRLALPEGGIGDFHPILRNRGIVTAAPGQRREVVVEVTDDCGNRSVLRFTLAGRTPRNDFQARIDSTASIIRHDRPFRHEWEGLSLVMPKGALYESCFYRPARSTRTLRRDTTVIVLSPLYEWLDASVPLHGAVSLSIRTFVPEELRRHVSLALRTRNGGLSFLGGRYEHGAVTGRIRKTGTIVAVADTVAPRIRPQFAEGADLSGRERLTVRLSDNFSGIESCSATIDGEWVPLDYSPVQGTATVTFDRRMSGGRTDSTAPQSHVLTITATDGCGNRARCVIGFRYR